VNSERVTETDVGMMSIRIKAGQQAHQWRRAGVREPSRKGGAEASTAANRQSGRCRPHALCDAVILRLCQCRSKHEWPRSCRRA
jgi:hypothetical protein